MIDLLSAIPLDIFLLLPTTVDLNASFSSSFDFLSGGLLLLFGSLIMIRRSGFCKISMFRKRNLFKRKLLP